MARQVRQRRSSLRAGHAFRADSPVVGAGALLGLLDNTDLLGVTEADILEGVDVDPARLRARNARISWNALSRALANLERAGVRPSRLEELGTRLSSSTHMRVTRIAGFFVRPEHLMYVALRWVGPALFPLVDHQLVYRGQEIDLTLEIPPHLPGSLPYMHICVGTFRGVPLMLDHPPAYVRARLSERRGEFHIRCQRRSMSIGRITKLARSLLSAPRVIATLAEQESELRANLELVAQWQRQFGDMLDALPDGVMVVRGVEPSEVVYANPALCRILSVDRLSQVIGRDQNELIHPEDRGQREIRMLRGDGTWVHCEMSEPQPIYFDGESARLRVVRDVTLRRQLEGQLAVADKIATLTNLAAGIAHELNNPLTLVQANLELHAAAHGRTPELDAAVDGARRAGAIVGDLNRLARPEGDQRESVQLADVIQSSVSLATGRLRSRATVDVRIDGAPPVMAHRGRLGQVLLNLLINAVDAFPDDRPPTHNLITVRLMRAGETAVVEVEDNAGGVAPELVDRLFEPFFTTKPQGEGTGLGLAVAQGIVAGYGGRVELDNRPGVGACFRIHLPLASGGATAPSRELAPAGPARILLVDDEAALANALRTGLELSGHEVVVETSGNRAIERLEDDHEFDAVVCDLSMPDGTGSDVYRFLIAHHPALAERMVFITGGANPAASSFLATVDNQCVEKPFLLDDLDHALARVLGGSGGAA